MSELRQGIHRATVSPALQQEDGWVRGRFRFPPEFTGFDGHFPGNPVLPAVVQMLTAQVLLEQHLGRPLVLCWIDNAKFLRQIMPGDEIHVAVRPHPKKGPNSYEATLVTDTERAATFTLGFDTGEAS